MGQSATQAWTAPGVDGKAVHAAIVREVRALGLDQPTTRRIVLELMAHLAIHFGGVALFFLTHSIPLRIVALFAIAFGLFGVASNAHTAAHRGTSKRRSLDDALAVFGFPLLATVSMTYWRQKHNVMHHVAPNVEGVDPDHDFAPWLAMASSEIEGKGKLARAWYGKQWLLLPLFAGLMLFQMRWLGFVAAVKALRGPRMRSVLVDLVAVTLSVVLFWVLPWVLASPAEAIVFNLGRGVMTSTLAFAIFAPAHIPHAASFFYKEDSPDDFFVHQLLTTIDFRAGRTLAFVCSGLNYQIEHHLFPSVSHPRLKQIAPIVQRHCAAAGLPYRVMGWGESLREVAATFAKPKTTVAWRAWTQATP
jgi:fatty acid desaturase